LSSVTFFTGQPPPKSSSAAPPLASGAPHPPSGRSHFGKFALYSVRRAMETLQDKLVEIVSPEGVLHFLPDAKKPKIAFAKAHGIKDKKYLEYCLLRQQDETYGWQLLNKVKWLLHLESGAIVVLVGKLKHFFDTRAAACERAGLDSSAMPFEDHDSDRRQFERLFYLDELPGWRVVNVRKCPDVQKVLKYDAQQPRDARSAWFNELTLDQVAAAVLQKVPPVGVAGQPARSATNLRIICIVTNARLLQWGLAPGPDASLFEARDGLRASVYNIIGI
jgi:hypothetical protein